MKLKSLMIYLLEVLEVLALPINDVYFLVTRKKMSSLYFNFAFYTSQEKIDLIKGVLHDQCELAKFMADFYGGVDLNIHLIFMILIKHLTFAEWFTQKIPNGLMNK